MVNAMLGWLAVTFILGGAAALVWRHRREGKLWAWWLAQRTKTKGK